MAVPIDPKAYREAKNRQEGLEFAHKMGLHQGNPDPKQGGCISCFTDQNNHRMFHTKNNQDPKCAYCRPKKG